MGLGKKMFEWAIERAKERKAHLLQLTTDKQRPEAITFYKNLGFKSTHEGMKMHFVITSYSIHYTKLYDNFDSIFLNFE